jgi:hypothetical protein
LRSGMDGPEGMGWNLMSGEGGRSARCVEVERVCSRSE